MDRSTSRTAAKAGASLLLAATAVAAGPAASALAAPAFYTPPATLPEANGALIRTETVTLGANIYSPEGKATRIMYRSTDTNGAPIAITGTYIEPKAPWYGKGPRPLVSYAAGTQGQGDQCAPSQSLVNAVSITDGSVNVGYETPSIAGLVNKGIAVVVTDYAGLGTPGTVHTYVNRVDQGHAVLDAARAALQVAGTTVTPSSAVGAFGYSQGGGAAASAAELQPTYAPDVNLKGAYAGAPPADLSAVMRTADGTSLTGVIGFAVNGFIETYPQLRPILDANTNANGKAVLAKLAKGCIGDAAGSVAFKKTSEWTTSGKPIATVVAGIPAAQAIVDAQRIGRIQPTAPVRITTGTRDDIVTHGQVKQLAVDWCALGATVSYSPQRQAFDSYGSALNHLTPMITESAASQKWLFDRLNGVPATSNCGSVPSLP